jgi:hypothetical protein
MTKEEKLKAISDGFNGKPRARWEFKLPTINWTKKDGKEPEDKVAKFVAEFNADPRAAYKKYGAGEIEQMMAEASDRNLMSPAERDKVWAAAQPPARPGTQAGTQAGGQAVARTDSQRAESVYPKAGQQDGTLDGEDRWGYRNALGNYWAEGNLVEPTRGKYTDKSKYDSDMAEWKALVEKAKKK